jgi:hypothetical protein
MMNFPDAPTVGRDLGVTNTPPDAAGGPHVA